MPSQAAHTNCHNPADKSGKAHIRQHNEQLILSCAEKVFASYGFKGSSTMQIAQMAGLPKANIHYYFETKAKLYECVLEHMLKDWMAAARMFKSHEDPTVTLTNYINAKMDLARKRPYGSRVWAKEIISGAPVVGKGLSSTLRAWVDDCITTIQQWIKDDKIIDIDPKTLLYMIWATTQHYADFDAQVVALNEGKRLSDAEYEQQKRHVVRLILASVGLQAKPT